MKKQLKKLMLFGVCMTMMMNVSHAEDKKNEAAKKARQEIIQHLLAEYSIEEELLTQLQTENLKKFKGVETNFNVMCGGNLHLGTRVLAIVLESTLFAFMAGTAATYETLRLDGIYALNTLGLDSAVDYNKDPYYWTKALAAGMGTVSHVIYSRKSKKFCEDVITRYEKESAVKFDIAVLVSELAVKKEAVLAQAERSPKSEDNLTSEVNNTSLDSMVVKN